MLKGCKYQTLFDLGFFESSSLTPSDQLFSPPTSWPRDHMGFFDLNIPYHESDRHATNKSSLKSRRLKLALKAMELGYTGIAYNRILKGVMSESDRCSIPPFPLSSLLKLVPSSSALTATVKFHRNLLNVAVSAPFRQYTRLTVIVDTSSQALALNTGNPILRSYDITAVRPLNQNAFDQACQTSEVDIITIDFSEKSLFRLKQPMVKAAIKRGVYFEITYSGLIGDAQSKRQMISNSKLLVEWTRGKNLIFSSASTSATELRGPQDVSNLFSLLGLPLEHAKAAISKNCRSLLANALRKKQFYKEAVKVEEIPSQGQVNPGQSIFDEWLNWDSISSGEGDLMLDDMEKSFFLSNITKKTVKAIDFTSTTNGLPAHGLLIKDLISGNKAAPEPPDSGKYLSDAMEIGEAAATFEKPEEQSRLYSKPEEQDCLPELQDDLNTVSAKHCGIILLPDCDASLGCVPKELVSITSPKEEGQTSLNDEKIHYQASGFEDSEMSSMPIVTDSSNIFSKFEETELISREELNYTNGMEAVVVATETRLQDRLSEMCGVSVLPEGGRVHNITMEAEHIPTADNHSSIEVFSPSNTCNFSASQLNVSKIENSYDVGIYTREDVAVDQVLNKTDSENERGQSLASSDATLQDIYTEGQQYKKMTDNSAAAGDKLSINLVTNFNNTVSENVMGELKQIDSDTRYHGLGKLQAGGERRKRNFSHQRFLFSFKRFLKPSHFKRKARKSH